MATQKKNKEKITLLQGSKGELVVTPKNAPGGYPIKGKRIDARGKTFEGTVTKIFPKRIVIEFERMVYVTKYERYAKSKTKIHARLPESLEKEINLGDLVRVQECRPLSKIIHFIVIKKIKSKEELK